MQEKIKLTFNNGTVKVAETIITRKAYAENANREIAEFHFAVEKDYGAQAVALDSLSFNKNAMRKITTESVDTHNIAIYNNYTIPLSIETKLIDIPSADGLTSTKEKRIILTMAQQFQSEVEQMQLRETVDMLVLSSLGGK